MRRAWILFFILIGCASHSVTISPQAETAIRSLPKAVIAAFRHQYTNVEFAQTKTRLLPDQTFEYVITFENQSGARQTVHYRADGTRID